MNKKELVKQIADKNGVSLKEAQRGIDTTLHIIRDTLKKGHKITLIGFGTFSTKMRSERTAKHFVTGKIIKVKAKKVVKFKAGKALAEIVHKSK